MRAEIHDRPAAQAFVPAPVAELVHVLEAVLLEPLRRNGIPIGSAEVRRDRAVPLPVDRHDAAEQLRLAEQLVVAVEVARIRAALVADLKELAGLARGRHHVPRPLERVRHLLLAVHVLAGLEAVDRVPLVPEVGRRDEDRVELLLLVEHLAVVLVGVGLVLVPLQAVDDAPLVVLRPDVAHRAEAQPWNSKHRVRQHLALRPRAQERDVDHLQIGGRHGRRGGRLRPRLLVLALFVPGVAEETERGDRGQSLQHFAPIQLLVGSPPPPAASPLPFSSSPAIAPSSSACSRLRRRSTPRVAPSESASRGHESAQDRRSEAGGSPRADHRRAPAGPRPRVRACARTVLRSLQCAAA